MAHKRTQMVVVFDIKSSLTSNHQTLPPHRHFAGRPSFSVWLFWSRRDQTQPPKNVRPAHNFSRYVVGKSGECGEDTGQRARHDVQWVHCWLGDRVVAVVGPAGANSCCIAPIHAGMTCSRAASQSSGWNPSGWGGAGRCRSKHSGCIRRCSDLFMHHLTYFHVLSLVFPYRTHISSGLLKPAHIGRAP